MVQTTVFLLPAATITTVAKTATLTEIASLLTSVAGLPEVKENKESEAK